jgi:hypothetical protein
MRRATGNKMWKEDMATFFSYGAVRRRGVAGTALRRTVTPPGHPARVPASKKKDSVLVGPSATWLMRREKMNLFIRLMAASKRFWWDVTGPHTRNRLTLSWLSE